jgi:hypothetical protein
MTLTRSKFSQLTSKVPPRSGPISGGLNIQYNTVKTVREKINGKQHRQSVTKRSANYKTT